MVRSQVNMEERPAPAAASGSRLEQLYREHAEPVFRLALVMTGDRELAADLTQDAFIRVASRFAHLRDPAALPGYLRRTVTNLVISNARRKGVEQRALAEGGSAPTMPNVAEGVETRELLWRRVLALPGRQRAAIVLRFYEDLSERQVADVLGVSPRAVNALVSRALVLLRTEGSEDAVEPDARG